MQIRQHKSGGEKLADQVIGIIMDESIEANEEELPELFRRMARIHERSGRFEIIKTCEALAKRIGSAHPGQSCRLAPHNETLSQSSRNIRQLTIHDGLKHIASTWIHQNLTKRFVKHTIAWSNWHLTNCLNGGKRWRKFIHPLGTR